MATIIFLAYIVTVVITLTATSAPEEAMILEAPDDSVVCLNDRMPATFACQTVGGLSGWWINGVPLERLTTTIRNESNISEVITDEGHTILSLAIPPRTIYNGTKIQCRLISFEGFIADETANATLFVQGQQVYSISDTTTQLRLSLCDSPFSLDVTNVSHEIYYSYTVNMPTITICTVCSHTTDTYLLTHYDIACTLFKFTTHEGYVLNATAVSRPSVTALTTNFVQVVFKQLENLTAGCGYSIDCDCILNHLSFPTYNLTADKEYSIHITIYDDVGGVAKATINFTTFDVQEVFFKIYDDSCIEVKVEFITNSTARGMFIVLESDDESLYFIALMRQDSSPLLTTTIDNIPLSSYQVFIYDLEENLLPHRNVAYQTQLKVSISKGFSNEGSNILNNVSVQVENGDIKVGCWFKHDIVGGACVLIYRESGSEILLVKEFSQDKKFPMTVAVQGQVDWAVFGKNESHFDRLPFMVKKTDNENSTSTTATKNRSIMNDVTTLVFLSSMLFAILLL